MQQELEDKDRIRGLDMDEKLVSVIIPAYNIEDYIGRCLDSIISQTYKNLEIIVVDDGSRDHTGEILDNYAKKDRRIKVIHKKMAAYHLQEIKGLKRQKEII